MTATLVTAGGIAKAWLGTLAMMAVQGTVLALIALVLTRAAGRLRPAWHAAIWLVVMLKFALPWGPGLPWSLSDLIAVMTARGGGAAAALGPPALEPAAPAPHLGPAIAWLGLGLVWAVIATIIVARAIVAHRRTAASARGAVADTHARTAGTPGPTHELVATLAARVGVRTPQLAIVTGSAMGPHVVGLVRATIVIPRSLLDEPALLQATLLHELAHLRRRDALARVVQVIAGALLFFWPVVRRVSRRLELARESACDAWALEAGDVPRPVYARLLVRMAELPHAHALAMAMPPALDARVAAVLGPPARPRISWLQRVVLAAFVAMSLGGARTASARGEQPTCHYTPQLGQALFLSYPEADLDGDGTLTRDEACELQAELRKHADELASGLVPGLSSESEVELETLLSEPLCCNCERAEAYSSPESASCHQVEGVDR
jgi:beta-lactamase regulating signal transducer with metallopeptidase domain